MRCGDIWCPSDLTHGGIASGRQPRLHRTVEVVLSETGPKEYLKEGLKVLQNIHVHTPEIASHLTRNIRTEERGSQ